MVFVLVEKGRCSLLWWIDGRGREREDEEEAGLAWSPLTGVWGGRRGGWAEGQTRQGCPGNDEPVLGSGSREKDEGDQRERERERERERSQSLGGCGCCDVCPIAIIVTVVLYPSSTSAHVGIVPVPGNH